MNFKNFKRCVNSQKYPRFCLPYSVLTCVSYEEFKFKATELRDSLIWAIQREKNEDKKTNWRNYVSELDYTLDIVERLEKV